jgi:hypothetical protein
MTAPTEPEKKFTQADLDRLIADRLTRERAKFADYDELKAAADAAAGSKSQLDKIQEKLEKAEQRAARAEQDAMRSSVAAELGLTPKQARRLSGDSREALLADGRELLDDLGIKPGAKDEDGKEDGANGTGDGNASDGGKAETGTADGDAQKSTAQRGKPKEALRSGAPMTETKTEEMDPLKLAAGVARRF